MGEWESALEELEDSREYVAANITYHHGGPDVLSHIIETVQKLPAEVIQFAITKCAFVSATEENAGCVLNAKVFQDSEWVVILGPGLAAQNAQNIVAHKIAHAWLRHEHFGILPSDHEPAVRALAAEWGFEDVACSEP